MEQIPNKRGLVKKILLLAVVVLLVCAVVAVSVFSGGFHLDSLRRWVKYMNVDEKQTAYTALMPIAATAMLLLTEAWPWRQSAA